MIKAVFLDKDGTLINNIPYNSDPELVALNEYAVDCLLTLQSLGYKFFVVSNQQGIAQGYFTEESLAAVFHKINGMLEQHGIEITDFYYCPHSTSSIISKYRKICNCRKPQPGLLLNAAAEWNIDLSASWMIGDILNDVEAGNRAGCKTILLNNGNETEWRINNHNIPRYVVNDLREAAYVIGHHVFVRRKIPTTPNHRL
jgi:D-glycero-D-manno-heptose 1,7-bisphosphate phosphatase